jgi:hypothetical protein
MQYYAVHFPGNLRLVCPFESEGEKLPITHKNQAFEALLLVFSEIA